MDSETTNKRPKGLPEESRILYFVYAGMRKCTKGVKHYAYIPTDDLHEGGVLATKIDLMYLDRSLHLYKKPLKTGIKPGAVISIWAIDKGGGQSVYLNTVEFVGYLFDSETVKFMEATAGGLEALWGLEALNKKMMAEGRLEAALEPVRKAYNAGRNRQERAAILANAISYITKG